MSRSLALLFPGQGSQRIGMLEAVPATEDVHRLVDAAEALAGVDLGQIAAHGPDETLADTRVAQPLLYLTDWAWARALESAGISPSVVAGHSLGEYAALAFAGVFSVEAGLELVSERARLMASAAEDAPGGMAAVLGLESADVRALVEPIGGVWVANDNAPGQVVLTGTHTGIERATHALTEAGARRVVPLNVAGAFHSPLMEPAAREFAAILGSAQFADARMPVVQNAVPEPTRDAQEIRDRLAAQMTAPVRWVETMEAIASLGISTVVESGPGAVLSGLARRYEGVEGLSAETLGVHRIAEVIGV